MAMQASSGGNLSVRLSEDRFLVKPTGIALYDLREEDLLVTDASGVPLEGSGRPTKEINSHLSIYSIRQDVGAIVHYHSPFATTYAVCGLEIPLMTVHAKRILGTIPTVPADREGSAALAASLAVVFENRSVSAALMFDHGIIAAGATLTKAQNVAELVEESARIAYLSRHF